MMGMVQQAAERRTGVKTGYQSAPRERRQKLFSVVSAGGQAEVPNHDREGGQNSGEPEAVRKRA
jgi:hypothetical protein